MNTLLVNLMKRITSISPFRIFDGTDMWTPSDQGKSVHIRGLSHLRGVSLRAMYKSDGEIVPTTRGVHLLEVFPYRKGINWTGKLCSQ